MSVGSVGGAPSTGSYCTKLVIFTADCQTASSSLPSTRGGVSVRIGRMVGRPTNTPSDRACASSAAAPSGAARSDPLREPSARDCEDSAGRAVGCAPAGDATDAIETVSTVSAATTVPCKFDWMEEVCALAEDHGRGRGHHQGSVTGWVSWRRAPAKIPCIPMLPLVTGVLEQRTIRSPERHHHGPRTGDGLHVVRLMATRGGRRWRAPPIR